MMRNNIKFKEGWQNLLPQSKLTGLTVAERNKQFESLSTNEQHIEIALDFLSMVDLGLIVKQAGGGYWESQNLYDITCGEELSPEEFQAALLEIDQKKEACMVCARGAFMLSRIRVGNTFGNRVNYIDMGDEDMGLDVWMLKAMENVYEGWSMNVYPQPPYPHKSLELLVNIYLNIISNEGVFDGQDNKDYLSGFLND